MSRISKTERQLQAQQEQSGSHLYATRVKVYPKSVHGPVRRFKWTVLLLCLGVYYVLPWLRWTRAAGQPNQAVLLDVWNERFYFFNLELWPQDIWLLAGLMIIAAVGLFLVTSLIGRVWCGYTCPQTVWTDLFMWVEEWMEGDRNARIRRDHEKMTFDTLWRKAAKHAIWLGIAFWTGGAWIMYFANAPQVTVEFWTGRASTEVYFFIGLFTFMTYVLAGWAREQVCTYMCPWPRFQSAMLDDQSFIVTYQGWRGEPRSRGKRLDTVQRDMAAGEPAPRLGDCVDCNACVAACPTGIDIRDGIQLECINCGLCIDACNHVMERTGQKKWLITWDTLSRQAAKKEGRHEPIRILRPRTIIYVTAMAIAAITLTVALLGRSTLNLSVQRDRAPLFVPLADGALRNGYTVKISNKTQFDADYTLSVRDIPGAALTAAEESTRPTPTLTLGVAHEQVGTFRVLVTARPAALENGTENIDFVLRNTGNGAETVYHSIFMGPAGYAPGPAATQH